METDDLAFFRGLLNAAGFEAAVGLGVIFIIWFVGWVVTP